MSNASLYVGSFWGRFLIGFGDQNGPQMLSGRSRNELDGMWEASQTQKQRQGRFQIAFGWIFEAKLVQNYSQNCQKWNFKSINNRSQNQLRNRRRYLMDLGCDFEGFLVPKSNQNLMTS